MTDPYLNLFRNLIPPLMGQIDFTPIFGFMVLQFLAQVLGACSARLCRVQRPPLPFRVAWHLTALCLRSSRTRL